LNDAVNLSLPVDGLVYLADFLHLPDASSNNATVERSSVIAIKSGQNVVKKDEMNPIAESLVDLYKTVSICESEVCNAKYQSVLALRLAQESRCQDIQSTNLSTPSLAPSFLLSSPSSQFGDAIYSALNKVMEERDNAHTQLVRAEVLHLCEIEEQQKKVAQLQSLLEAENSTEADQNVKPPHGKEKMDAKLNRQESNLHRDADSELLSLCQQLAGEISARTAADMELVRLKEIRRIEQELEAAEKRTLLLDLKLVKEQLLQRNESLELALKDAHCWRESFEEVARIRKGAL
jgi:hypothetical protein